MNRGIIGVRMGLGTGIWNGLWVYKCHNTGGDIESLRQVYQVLMNLQMSSPGYLPAKSERPAGVYRECIANFV
jgi:hypothetical protein